MLVGANKMERGAKTVLYGTAQTVNRRLAQALKGNRHDFCYCPYTKLCLSYCHILNIFVKYQLLCKI